MPRLTEESEQQDRWHINCPVCGYSASPETVRTERKHFTAHSFRCHRCHYQTETKPTWLDAKRAWNKSPLRRAALAQSEEKKL